VASYANSKHRSAPPSYMTAGVDPIERYMSDVIIHGSPERVADKIAELRETVGIDYLMCAPLSHQSFMLFNEEVLPKLR
jgi:alkanesulfonate monooxygenase SsuD/methylene tetrahydromethanopterin reductase-like flavin-dependent oxidoreductase (luciferase family)